MSQTTHQSSIAPHLRSDLAMFFGVFIVVLSGVIGLYIYDLKTAALRQFASQLFHWLVN